MENLLRDKIVNLHKDFLDFNIVIEGKNKEIQDYKKDFSKSLNVEDSVEIFSNLVADFTLLSRDTQIIFTELFSMIKLYNDLNFETLPNNIIEFYNNNLKFLPKKLFVSKDGGIVEKEEGTLKAERERFLKSDYLKSLINANT